MKDTKSWILDAAAMLFTQNGYNGTTTRAIAELAGVSESTFFRIYKSKDALLTDLLYIMTPGPEDIPMKEMTNGADIEKDFELFLYYNAILHIRHLPVFRLAMHLDEVYDISRFSKIKGLVSQMAEYFRHLQEIGFLIDFDYDALAEHINALSMVKASEFITGEIYGVPMEQSVQTFSKQYAEFFARMLIAEDM
ncbi:MAG: TetR/AcrR family transcriptional regulator [Lachnospiraceae bacterium]|nr:TetR/AcrR family transcriptional regulator [Lachnospiraceae bacterium]